MKKQFLIFLSVFMLLISSCSKENEWKLKESINQQYYIYEIIDAPETFKAYIGTKVYKHYGQQYESYGFSDSCEDRIIEYLNKENFEKLTTRDGKKNILLPVTFDKVVFNNEQLNYIWDILSQNYAAFPEMTKKGFSKRKLLKVKNETDFYRLFDNYVNDCHFAIRVGKNFFYDQPTARDEGTFRSQDPLNIYFEKETSNAYYIRFNDCKSYGYWNDLPYAGSAASKKDFIILDARSNEGGDLGSLAILQRYLESIAYQGQVIILQDNWSFSSGEIWHIFGKKNVKTKCTLVGTHSGGMQRLSGDMYQNPELDIIVVAGKNYCDDLLPDNWLGEGKGYEPQIWATTENMKEVLEAMGIDLEDIIFQ